MSATLELAVELVDHPDRLARIVENLRRQPLLFADWEREAIRIALESVESGASK